MWSPLVNLLGAISFSSEQAYNVNAWDAKCLILPSDASLSLSLNRDNPLHYALLSPGHVDDVNYYQAVGYTISPADYETPYFTGTLSPDDPYVDLGSIPQREKYCLRVNSPVDLRLKERNSITWIINNGLCLPDDQVVFFKIVSSTIYSLVVCFLALLKGLPSIVMWRELSTIIMAVVDYPSFIQPQKIDNSHLSIIAPFLHTIFLILYFPLHSFWTPFGLIFAALGLSTDVSASDISFLSVIVSCTLIILYFKHPSPVGVLAIFERCWSTTLGPLLDSTPFVNPLVKYYRSVCQWLGVTAVEFYDLRLSCGLELELSLYAVALKLLLISILMILVRKPLQEDDTRSFVNHTIAVCLFFLAVYRV